LDHAVFVSATLSTVFSNLERTASEHWVFANCRDCEIIYINYCYSYSDIVAKKCCRTLSQTLWKMVEMLLITSSLAIAERPRYRVG